MTHLMDYRDGIVERTENPDDTFTEIKRKLLDDFDTAETVRKVLRSSKNGGDSREPVKVYLRIKPLTTKELQAGESQDCLEIENWRTVALHPPKTSFTFRHQARHTITGETIQRFTFSHVFGPETNQRKFFEDTSLDVVKDFINGQNCLVFSYGITNAGKTYTILGNPENLGVLPRTINILFNSFKNQNYERTNLKPKMFCEVRKLSSIQEQQEESKKKGLLSLHDATTYHQSISTSDLSLQDSSQEQYSQEDMINLSSLLDVTSVDVDDQGPIKFCLWISFAEIYNEYIYDLLEPISMQDKKRTVLKVGDDRKGNPYVKGLTEIHVNNADEAFKLLKIGRKNQKIASTKLNESSSRSHCIFTLKILRVVDTKEPHVARVSRLSFVDLAGSERYTKTQTTGIRLKEAGNINTSIMTLGKCVELLRFNQNHPENQKNIPFRESKLTRLFQGFFCGKGKASMIVNVNQCASAFDETLHALKFSAIAKKVTTVVQGPRPEIPSHAAHPSVRSTRSSVAWADGSTCTPARNKARLKSEESVVKEESELEVFPGVGEQNYQKIIAALQEQLVEERKQNALMEVKIREEVCQEMAEQLVEIEKNYNERMVEEQRATEELYEKRMDILSKSVKKARKRPRVDHIVDDDDEWVSSVLLHKEQVKNKELSERIAELEEDKRIEQLEDELTRLVRESGLDKERLEKELASREQDVKTKEAELTQALERGNRITEDLEGKIANLKQELADVLERSEKEVTSRHQEYEAKEAEFSEALERGNKKAKELEEKIASLEEERAKDSERLNSEVASRDEEKDLRIAELGEKVQTLEASHVEECARLRKELSSRIEQIEQLERTIKDCQVEVETKNTQLLAAKKVQGGRSSTPTKNNLTKQLEKRLKESTMALDKKNSQLISKNNAITKLEYNLKELQVELSKKERDLSELKAKLDLLNESKGREDSKDITINELNAQLKEQECNLLNKTKEKEEVEENLKFVEGELQILKENQAETRSLKEELDELKEKAKKWTNETEKHEETTGDLKKQLETQAGLVKEREHRVEELMQIIATKEEDLRRCKDLHSKQVAELNVTNRDLQENFDKALQDLSSVQATVVERNQKLDDLESQDMSLKEAQRCKDAEIARLKEELQQASDEARGRNKALNELKDQMEHKIREEVLKESEKWVKAHEQMKTGLEEQDEVLAQMENDLASKDDEVAVLDAQVKQLLEDNKNLGKLTKENEDLDDQCERYKIKIFELETEVEKLQQDVLRETTKKDSATQALKDGLEIVKAKKIEYETKTKEVKDEKKCFEVKIADLEEEVRRLKSASSDSDDKTDLTEKEAGDSTSGDRAHCVYKPLKVESFDIPHVKDRVEIDVTPITGSGLPAKSGKKTASNKTKTLKRNSSDLTLREIQLIRSKSSKKDTCSEDDFTPISVTKLRKTRSSSAKAIPCNITSSPSASSLSIVKEDRENSDPKSSQKRGTAKKRFLRLPEGLKSKTDDNIDTTAKCTKKKRKLFTKTEISGPFNIESPLAQKKTETTPNTRAQEVIGRRLRSRVAK